MKKRAIYWAIMCTFMAIITIICGMTIVHSSKVATLTLDQTVTYNAPTNIPVTAYGNGGSFASGDTYNTYITFDMIVGNKVVPNPTKTGYTLNGWEYSVDDVTYSSYTNISDNIPFTDHLYLRAQWTVNTYYVRFNKNNNSATGTMLNQSFTYGESKTLTANAFTLTGYVLVGWNTQADGSGTNYSNEQSVSNLSSTNGAIIDLYAQWRVPTPENYFTWNGTTLLGFSEEGYKSGVKDIVIPAKTTAIGANAFRYSYWNENGTNASGTSGVTSVAFAGNSVETIGSYAFRNCSSLTSIDIPSRVTSIGTSAFSGCSGLASITMGDSVASIGRNAFYGCSSLASITIPSSVTSIGDESFYGCSSLASITIPSSVTSIGWSAFQFCFNLASITIPSSVTSIGGSAFRNCRSLASITLGGSVTSIGDDAFAGCSTSLTSIVVDAGNTKYKSSGNCLIDKSYKTLLLGCRNSVIPSDGSVTSIGYSAFYGCSSLTSISIPSSVTSIGSSAFYNCTSLTSISIPSSVTSIGSSAFYNCTSLTSIVVDAGNTKYKSSGNCLIDTSSKTLLLGCRNSVIPSDGSVTSIGESAFESCSSLTSISIPSSVTSIGIQAFYNCSSLESIIIPSSVTSIGYRTFGGCTGLTSITIPSGVTSIGSSAFSGCTGLTSITIPSGVTSIGSSAFSGCSNLASITIPSSVTSIGSDAFYNCTSLASVTIEGDSGSPSLSIGSNAFRACTSLTSIFIPSRVTTITTYSSSSNSPFYDCSSTLVINCACAKASKPSGWEIYWNYYARGKTLTVNWGQTR